jgi:hypothetical protein
VRATTVVMGAGDVHPEASAWAAYARVWPHRYLRWSRDRQLWEVWQRHPLTGQDVPIEPVFYWDIADPDTCFPPSAEEITEALKTNDSRLRKRYRPFDWRFVRERLANRWEFHCWSIAEWQRRRQQRAKEVQRASVRAAAAHWAAVWGEGRR